MRRLNGIYGILTGLALILVLPLHSFGESLEGDFRKELEKSGRVVASMKQKLAANQNVSADLQAFKGSTESIVAIDMLLKDRYQRHLVLTKGKGPRTYKRHANMTSHYSGRVSAYLKLARKLEKVEDVTWGRLKDLEDFYKETSKKRKWPVFGSLPYSHLNCYARLPVMEPVIVPAYNGGGVPSSEGDLSTSPGVQVSKTIAEFAATLNWNPVTIYEWVKNNVKTEWYWGCMKGAEETLRQKSGNDCDQAALLVALLRASGYRSRFVRGAVNFFPDLETAKNLIGIESEKELGIFLQKSGIPNTPVVQGGRIANYTIDHIWVESEIPYSNYRGAVIDANGKQWMAMDTSIKVAGMDIKKGLGVPSGFDIDDVRDNYLSEKREETLFEFLENDLTTWLSANQKDTAYDNLLTTRTLKQEVLNIVPGSLQIKPVAITGEYAAIPPELFHRIEFKASAVGAKEPLFSVTLANTDLSNRRIAISYEPDTVEDLETINSFGGLSNTPSYLVKLRPVLRLDGETVVAAKDGLQMGEEFVFTMNVITPSGTSTVSDLQLNGNLSVIGIVSGTPVPPKPVADSQKDAERIYYEKALNYIGRWNQSEQDLASLLGIVFTRPAATIVKLGGVAEVETLFEESFELTWKGVYLDADFRVVETSGDAAAQKRFMQLSSAEGSTLESRLLEDEFGVESVSTAKVFGIAQEGGHTLVSLTRANLAAELPLLPYPENIKNHIKDAVNSNLTVRIPRSITVYENWTGTGYITENPDTGESGWMLTGLIAGGMTVWDPNRWAHYADVLAMAFELPPNADPSAALTIQKIADGDYQKSPVGELTKKPIKALVRDADGCPVRGVKVAFTARAGGGSFENGNTQTTAITDSRGIATVENFKTGTRTDTNPEFITDEGDTHFVQVGENLIDAKLIIGSQESIKSPFVIYGIPKEPVKLRLNSYIGDGVRLGMFAGSVKAVMEDMYGNSISNQPVDIMVALESSLCPGDHPPLLCQSKDINEKTVPLYGECGNSSELKGLLTSPFGLVANVYSGWAKGPSTYRVTATSGSFLESFTFKTYVGSCSDFVPLRYDLILNFAEFVNDGGSSIHAAKTGDYIDINASMYMLSESLVLSRSTEFNCGEEHQTCTEIGGGGVYVVEKDLMQPDIFQGAELWAYRSYSNSGSHEKYSGIYDEASQNFTIKYPVVAGVQTVELRGSVSRKHLVMDPGNSCHQCGSAVERFVEKYSGTSSLTVFGVDIILEKKLIVPVDAAGYTTCDAIIRYRIEPASYKASKASYVRIYKNDVPDQHFLSETQGECDFTIAKGTYMGFGNIWSADVVLNYGTPYEIVSDRIMFTQGDITIHPITIKDDKYPLPVGDSARAMAVVEPATAGLFWSMPYKTPGVLASINSRTGVIKTDKKSGSGYVKIRVEASSTPCVFQEAMIFIGCQSCEDNGSTCNTQGSAFFNVSSVDARFSLGKAKEGKSAGDIYLRADIMSPSLYTPSTLELSSFAKDVEKIFSNDTLRQILTPTTFIDIVPIDAYAYEIRYYNPQAVTIKTNGIYGVNPSRHPFKIWRIENPDRSATVTNRLLVRETVTNEDRYEYTFDDNTNTWTLNRGNSDQVTGKSETIDPVTLNRIEIKTVKDKTGKVASKEKTEWHIFPWGEEIVAQITDPDGAALSTLYTYYETKGEAGGYKKIKSVTSPGGSTVQHYYDDKGRTMLEFRTWLDSGTSRTYYQYTSVDPLDIPSADNDFLPRTETETLNGLTVSQTYHAYIKQANGERIEITEQCATSGSPYGSSTNLRTITTYYLDGTALSSGKVKTVQYPDGRLDTYTYDEGCFTCPMFTTSGDEDRHTVVHGTVASPSGIANKTTRDIEVYDGDGDNVISESYVYTGTGFELLTRTTRIYDTFGRLLTENRADGTSTQSTYSCCNKDNDTDETGVTTDYDYDTLKRLASVTRQGLKGDITTTYTYDALGRRLTETVASGGKTLTSATHYDTAGRIDYTVDAAGFTTDYDYSANGLTTTVTRPGGITEITTRYTDGQTKSVTGAGVIPRFYSYGADGYGVYTRVYTGYDGSPQWEKTTTDMLGRTVLTEKPGPLGTETTENIYNTQGQLVRTKTTGQADTLYVYDDTGAQFRTGLDVDGNGILVPASMDRISDTEAAYAKYGASWWQESKNKVYATDNSGTATLTGTSRQQISGLGADGKVAESRTYDIHTNATISQTFVDPANKRVTTKTDVPDSTTDAVTITEYGLTTSATSKTGVTVTFDYDTLGRQTETTDPRTGTTVTHYNGKGQVDFVRDPADHATQFVYDPVTGRKTAQTNALGKTTRFAYNNAGQITRTWGDDAYPVKYDYDAFGRMAYMITYRTNHGFAGESWPTNTTDTDVTTWDYDPATGLLQRKTDASGKAVAYTYVSGGKLHTRTWARKEGSNPVVTTYGYDTHTGELSGIDYADTTPDITFEYDRLGRQKTVIDALGQREFAYDDADLSLDTETTFGLINTTMTRNYETSTVPGRDKGFTIGSGYSVNYNYDTRGRFNGLSWTASGQSGSASYAYVPNSDLLSTITTPAGASVTYGYEPHRNLKTTVENRFGGALASEYGYAYDAIGRRTSVKNTGAAFTQNAFNKFGYNDRNELINSTRYLGSDTENLSQPVDPEKRIYNYDPIGNRNTATEGTTATTYEPNGLNQYESVAKGGDSEDLEYDDDGNLISYSGKKYTYNAENRLISVEPESPSTGDKKLVFVYDYMGRRIQKIVSTYASGAWSLATNRLFIYDGWNLAQELNGSGTVQNAYVWGLDLSQSLQGAGGVGGLIASVDAGTSKRYFYCFDGNGNVGQVVDAADGSIDAYYEYDPFGNTIRDGGVYAQSNPFRFSTKYLDDETGLYYYGYRFYNPEFGRWVNRDPIEEDGGLNIYGFVNNSPNNIYDPFGRDFIALGIRPVDISALLVNGEEKGFHLFANHSSIEYWESPCPAKEGKEHWAVDFKKSGAKRIDSFELMKDTANKWYVWENKGFLYGQQNFPNLYKPLWALEQVGVSIITYNTSTANRFAAFYEPTLPNKQKVNDMWKYLKSQGAKKYPFAEQTVNNQFNGSFQKWPNSLYSAFGNNCNAFSRWIIKKIAKKEVPDPWGTLLGHELPETVAQNQGWHSDPPALRHVAVNSRP